MPACGGRWVSGSSWLGLHSPRVAAPLVGPWRRCGSGFGFCSVGGPTSGRSFGARQACGLHLPRGRGSHWLGPGGGAVLAFALWEARPQGEALARGRPAACIRRGSRLSLVGPWWRCGSGFGFALWEARPRGEALARAGRRPAFAAGVAAPTGWALVAVRFWLWLLLCGRPDLGAKLWRAGRSEACIRRGVAALTGWDPTAVLC